MYRNVNEGKTFTPQCPVNCTFHESKIGPESVKYFTELKEKGYGSRRYGRAANEFFKREISANTIYNHLSKHYREVIPVGAEDGAPSEPEPEQRVSDVQILESIIYAGFKNSKYWKPTIKDTLEAMKLKAQMTGNSAFEDMLAAMELAEDFEEEEVMENPEAIGAPAPSPEDDDAE